MAQPKVALLSCGSFNPLTNMHMRMFELARDHFNKTGQFNVVCGIVSPVHDGYRTNKKLASATHRCAMIEHALESNDWVRMSNWECQQEAWCKTRVIVQYHQNQLNAIVNGHTTVSPKKRAKRVKDGKSWIPENLKNHADGNIQVKLLCGADLLVSMGTPGLWDDEDIATIVGEHGLVVITREGSNPYKFIYESDLLTKFQNNITIVTEWITNDVSSTKVRRSLERGQSVKYLIPDSVIDYVKRHGIYNVNDKGHEDLHAYCD